MDSLIQYNNAVNAIKTAILQGQYEAAKGVNRIQLALYFAIGKYLSQHTRKGVWGEGALASISEQLRKELPGLRGFSETQLRDMRRFYEAWDMLDSNSAVATAELQNNKNHIQNFRMWFKFGLKAQKLLAQGIALGIIAISKALCKGKSFMYCLEF